MASAARSGPLRRLGLGQISSPAEEEGDEEEEGGVPLPLPSASRLPSKARSSRSEGAQHVTQSSRRTIGKGSARRPTSAQGAVSIEAALAVAANAADQPATPSASSVASRRTSRSEAMSSRSSTAANFGGSAYAALKTQLKVLRLSPGERTADDLKTIVSTFSEVEFFKQLDPVVRTQLCGVLRLKHYDKNQIIFREGEIGDQFYIILHGEVGVYVGSQMEEAGSKKRIDRYREPVKIADVIITKDSTMLIQKKAEVIAHSPGPEEAAAGKPCNKEMCSKWLEKYVGLVNNTAQLPQKWSSIKRTMVQPGRRASCMSCDVVDMASAAHSSLRRSIWESELENTNAWDNTWLISDVRSLAHDIPRKVKILEETAGDLKASSAEPARDPRQASNFASASTEEAAEDDINESDETFSEIQSERESSEESEGSDGPDDFLDKYRDELRAVSRSTRMNGAGRVGGRRKSSFVFKGGKRQSTFERGRRASASGKRHSALDAEVWNNEVATCTAGAAFGEVALQTDQPRTASVRTKGDTFLATLTRTDYTAILQQIVENQHAKRQTFLMSIPVFDGISAVSIQKIAYMLQQRAVFRNEHIYLVGAQPLQVYLVKDGEFAVCYPVDEKEEDEQRREEEKREEPLAATSGLRGRGSGDATSSRPQALEHISASKRKYIVAAAVTPGTVVGLSWYLRGEKRCKDAVKCSSAHGTVYSIFAKELVSHLPRDVRSRLQAAAYAEERFFANRMSVLRRMEATSAQKAAGRGGRRWPQQQSVFNMAAAKARNMGLTGVYNPDGRLRIIQEVFQQHAALSTPVDFDPPLEAVPLSPKAGLEKHKCMTNIEEETEGKAEDPAQILPCWRCEADSLSAHAGIESDSRMTSFRLPAVFSQSFAADCWNNGRLVGAFTNNLMHTDVPAPPPRFPKRAGATIHTRLAHSPPTQWIPPQEAVDGALSPSKGVVLPPIMAVALATSSETPQSTTAPLSPTPPPRSTARRRRARRPYDVGPSDSRRKAASGASALRRSVGSRPVPLGRMTPMSLDRASPDSIDMPHYFTDFEDDAPRSLHGPTKGGLALRLSLKTAQQCALASPTALEDSVVAVASAQASLASSSLGRRHPETSSLPRQVSGPSSLGDLASAAVEKDEPSLVGTERQAEAAWGNLHSPLTTMHVGSTKTLVEVDSMASIPACLAACVSGFFAESVLTTSTEPPSASCADRASTCYASTAQLHKSTSQLHKSASLFGGRLGPAASKFDVHEAGNRCQTPAVELAAIYRVCQGVGARPTRPRRDHAVIPKRCSAHWP